MSPESLSDSDVSVILPTYNRLGFLEEAIRSVFAQTVSSWELVIADDGSGPETQAFLRGIADPRVRTVWLQHSGNPSRVRNAAIAVARGRFLAFLDSDDLWAPSKLEKQLAALRQSPECRWSYTACERIDHNGQALSTARPMPVPRSGWIFAPLLRFEVAIAMPAVMAERDLVTQLGGFDEQQLFGEFHDLCLRLALSSQAASLMEALCSVRAHAEHYSADRLAAHASWMRLYRKMAMLATNPADCAYCERQRMEASLRLAGLQQASGHYGAALGTLRAALVFSWRYPKWWLAAFRSLCTPLIARWGHSR